MDNFRVPDELDSNGATRLTNVIIPDGVVVALNRNDEESVDRANIFQHARNFLRLSDVESWLATQRDERPES